MTDWQKDVYEAKLAMLQERADAWEVIAREQAQRCEAVANQMVAWAHELMESRDKLVAFAEAFKDVKRWTPPVAGANEPSNNKAS